MLKYGTVTEVDPKGFVRVKIEEDEIVTQPIAVIFRRTSKDKDYMLPDVGDHVACLVDENCEDGVCLGAIYSEADAAPYTDANKSGVKFSNGDVIEFDRTARLYHIKTDTTEFTIDPAGFTLKKGTETLKKIMSDLLDAIIAETHATGTGPSGPPINIADFTAIKTRIGTFFEN